ncbi:hypothetical protein [Streptomyces himalayensis]|uniref:Uncharacterized protein n=1 Tax=Streptomyces himalayensis subsp. himalayensis TaxID=2756131 RepID=A0A7W0ICS6_9ACTN|nr:hypothetical protein [Streptomyces himalayensis]MBA2950868.1 hypothetical protein [Streptomyces himalayensis subsp. himalayensis]
MDRLLPDPRTPVGYRRDGRPTFPILSADPTDASNDQLPDPAAPPSAAPAAPAVQPMDQETLSKLLARERQQGERASVRKLVERRCHVG